ALALELREAPLEQRDPASCLAAVALELGLAGAARADAAAEPLEMLPHAPHARQVVLELRQLHLELALGSHRVLREDVQDQLRSVDDARVQGVLEEALLDRVELIVDEQGFGAERVVALLQLLELALADVGPPHGSSAVLHDAADRLDPGCARELLDFGELVGGL